MHGGQIKAGAIEAGFCLMNCPIVSLIIPVTLVCSATYPFPIENYVGSFQPRGTITVLSIASDDADLVRVISSGLLRQDQDLRPTAD